MNTTLYILYNQKFSIVFLGINSDNKEKKIYEIVFHNFIYIKKYREFLVKGILIHLYHCVGNYKSLCLMCSSFDDQDKKLILDKKMREERDHVIITTISLTASP